MNTETVIAFEPWSLGDAVMACRAAKERPDTTVQIASRWVETVKALWPDLAVKTLDLLYPRKGQGWSNIKKALRHLVPDRDFDGRVISIRGDVRDRCAARRLYPRAQTAFSGGEAFWARHSRLMNLPFRLGLWPVRNRYSRWAHALRVDLPLFNSSPPVVPVKRILIHMGAQWLSKRYPWSVPLRDLLRSKNVHADLALGPDDPPIEGTEDNEVLRLAGPKLVKHIRESADLVLCNDSAPMHIAAALGKPVAVFSAMTDIREWVPPGRVLIFEQRVHRGYGASPFYKTDHALPGEEHWHPPGNIPGLLVQAGWLPRKD